MGDQNSPKKLDRLKIEILKNLVGIKAKLLEKLIIKINTEL